MSPGVLLESKQASRLSHRDEYAKEDEEWEEFYRKHREVVPTLVGNVESLRKTMLNVKMNGQSKVAPINMGLTVSDHAILSSNNTKITLRVYTPSQKRWAFSVMIYFHGGGWALGDLDGEDRTCRAICISTGLVVVSVDYRLAPEHPYPAALNDAWAALQWVLTNPASVEIHMKKIFVGGTSAGANLAAVLCHQAKAHGIIIHGQLLRIPIACQSEPHSRSLGLRSMQEFHSSPILCRQSMVQFLKWYNPPDVADLTISPLLATDFANLPPAFIQICGRDPLRDEGLAYADKLEQFGVPVRVNVYQGLPHAFWVFPELSTTSDAANDMLGGLQWLLERSSDSQVNF